MKNMATVLQSSVCVALAFSLSNLVFAVCEQWPAVHNTRGVTSQPVHLSGLKTYSLVIRFQ